LIAELRVDFSHRWSTSGETPVAVECTFQFNRKLIGRTDEQTDRRTHNDRKHRTSIASRGKNGSRETDHAHYGVVCHPKTNTWYRLHQILRL